VLRVENRRLLGLKFLEVHIAIAPLSANMHEKIILQLLNSIKIIGKD
jgi:hypothetical protein